MRRLLFIVSAVVFIGLVVFFFQNLQAPPPSTGQSPLIGRLAPLVKLPALDRAARRFTSADLRAGHVSVVNVWASWCAPCRAEAPQLAHISRSGRAELYGIVYEDNSAAARAFLKATGNPFARLDLDADGREGRAWGIYGVPETFVVDRQGVVRLRFAGPIVADALAKIIMPAIVAAERES